MGEKTFIARKGATIFAPRTIPHAFGCIGKAPGRVMTVVTPAGFEQYFEEAGALTPEQRQIPRVIGITKEYGLELLPPPR